MKIRRVVDLTLLSFHKSPLIKTSITARTKVNRSESQHLQHPTILPARWAGHSHDHFPARMFIALLVVS